MGYFEDFIGGAFGNYQGSSNYSLGGMAEIMRQQQKFEKNLDDMWASYSNGNPAQIVEYNKGVEQIKGCGLKVLRNSEGKHRIVVPK